MSDIFIFSKETKKLLIILSTRLKAYTYRYNLLSQKGIDTYTEKEKKNKISKKFKSLDKKEIKNEAWFWFSIYIRLKYSDENGYVKCITCGKIAYWEKSGMQAGHYVDGRRNSVLLHEKIVYPQCEKCNIFLKGNKNKYTEFMKEQGYSDQDLMFFENLKNQICKKVIKEWEWERDRYKKLALAEAKNRGIQIN